MSPDSRKADDMRAEALTAMREPPGRLGDIVRRLKQAQPSPPRLIALMASAGEGHGK